MKEFKFHDYWNILWSSHKFPLFFIWTNLRSIQKNDACYFFKNIFNNWLFVMMFIDHLNHFHQVHLKFIYILKKILKILILPIFGDGFGTNPWSDMGIFNITTKVDRTNGLVISSLKFDDFYSTHSFGFQVVIRKRIEIRENKLYKS